MNAPFPHRLAQAFRTLFSTEHRSDAILAGFDGPTQPGTDGGFAVHFDGRGSVPTLIINGSDGEVSICGAAAIRELANAAMKAEQLALRQEAA